MYPGLSEHRIVVVQAEASPGVLLPWIPVGAFVAESPVPVLTIVVQLTFSFRSAAPPGESRSRAQMASLAEVQEPLTGDMERAEPPGAGPSRDELHIIPALVPHVTVDSRDDEDLDVALTLDAVRVDVEHERAVLVYRGEVPLAGTPTLSERIALSLGPPPGGATGEAPEGAEGTAPFPSRRVRAASLMRGRFGFALRPHDLTGTHEATSEEEAERLESARFDTWSADAPAPAISLERYVHVSAELVERPAERDRILSRHDFDEHSWTIEERAWAERMGREALDGDGTLADRYADLFVKHQDTLASPEELARPLVEYAKIRAHVESAADTEVALAEQELSLASYLRMTRRWESAAKQDPAIARELSRLVAGFLAEIEGGAT